MTVALPRLAVAAALVAALLALPAQTAPPAAAQSPETLTGVVRNGTDGAPAPVGLAVSLTYQAASGEVVERRTAADATGAFRFDALPPQGNPGFVVSAVYEGVEYTLRRLGEPLQGPLTLDVYELTNDFSALSVVDDTLAVTGADGRRGEFAVLEAVKLRNTSDRTFRADVIADGPMSMVRFSLPDGARDLEVEASLPGGHVLQVDRGFALTMPVPPGDHDLLYVYRVPYEDASKEYTPNFPMGAEVYRVMAVEGVAQGRGPEFREPEALVIGGTAYTAMETGPLAPGMRAALTLEGLPQPTLWERAQNIAERDGTRQAALPAAMGVVLTALLIVALWRRRAARSHGSAEARANAPAAYDDLVEAIVALDLAYDAGAIDEAAYRQRRAELLSRAGDAP